VDRPEDIRSGAKAGSLFRPLRETYLSRRWATPQAGATFLRNAILKCPADMGDDL